MSKVGFPDGGSFITQEVAGLWILTMVQVVCFDDLLSIFRDIGTLNLPFNLKKNTFYRKNNHLSFLLSKGQLTPIKMKSRMKRFSNARIQK